MTRQIVDAGMRESLHPLPTEVDLMDENGNLLGLFIPKDADRKRREEQAKSLFDLDEADRTFADRGKGFTIKEVHEYLHSLEPKK